ncbi:hypothetical protein QFZ58_003511 [Streptomyces sp. B1I3]|nr:hypothetical protein [Streptomyces sp. B1I3]
MVDERDERMTAEGLLPDRDGVLLPGVCRDQHAVDVHYHLAVSGSAIRHMATPDG